MGVVLPLRRGGGVSVPPTAAPGDVISLLTRDGASQETWLEAAQSFLVEGNTDVYQALLKGVVAQAPGTAPEPISFPVVQAHCALAAWYCHQARTNRSLARASFNEANSLLFNARSRALDDALPLLGMGQLALDRDNNRGTARQHFLQAAKHRIGGRATIAPLLALAALDFAEGSYKEALHMYKQALKACPGCPAEVRLGIASCRFRLGDTARAGAAFQRALDLSPSCTEALLGLAVLKFSASKSAEAMKEGSRLLVRAFEQDPDNPYVLVLLAHFSLQQGFAEGASRLARRALDASSSDPLRLECSSVLARSLHALGRPNEAYRHYRAASALDPRAPLPALGLAQLAVLQGEATNAASVLEGVLAVVPAWTDALELLGKLYPRLKPSPAAAGLPHFKAALARDAGRADLWEMLGDVLAPLDPPGALAAYRRAGALLRAARAAGEAGGGTPPPPPLPARLLNNTAVLELRAGNAEAARESMDAALASAGGGGLGGLGAEAQVTMGYNLARVREASGEVQAAARDYADLLAQFPKYTDPYIRLAGMAAARGNAVAAEDWARKALVAVPGCADALAFLAGLHLEVGQYQEAKEALDQLLVAAKAPGGGPGGGATPQQESYARVALGNLNLYTTPRERRTPRDAAKAVLHLSYAADEYARVLSRDPGNLWAAQGLGCVLGEAGHLREAAAAFAAVREAAAAADGFVAVPDVGVNLAHVSLAEESYGAAVAGYSGALRARGARPAAAPRVLLCLARALHDANRLPEARRALARAAHLDPTSGPAWFDLGLTAQEHAVRRVNARGGAGAGDAAARLAECEGARRALETAHRIFTALQGRGARATGLKVANLASHIDFVAATHKKTQVAVEAARREAALSEARREEQRMVLDAAQKQRAVEVEEARLRREAAAKAREATARAHAQRLEALKVEWKDAAVLQRAVEAGDASKVPRGGSKKGRKSAVDAAADAAFYVEDEEGDVDFDPDRPDAGSDGGEEEPQETSALAAAGLLSSDEEDADFVEEEAAERREEAREGAKRKVPELGGEEGHAASPVPRRKLQKAASGRRGGGGAEDSEPAPQGAAEDTRSLADLFDSDSDDGSFDPGQGSEEGDQAESEGEEGAVEGAPIDKGSGSPQAAEEAGQSGGKRGRQLVLNDSDADE